jgi:CPA2 family monovalent cation:H+ antiporter-2
MCGGEFGLVLLSQAAGLSVLPPAVVQVVLAAMILSMLIAPFIIEKSEHMVRRFSAADWMYRAMALHNIAAQTLAAEKHVIICGYGRSGQYFARLMEQENVPFIALDVDPQRVHEAAAAGRGGVRRRQRREVLIAAGLTRASALSYPMRIPPRLRILHAANEPRSGMPVVVRTVDDSDIDCPRRRAPRRWCPRSWKAA